MTDDLSPLSPRPARLGPFVIESELGRGGMGIVYRATQEGLNRPVALKILDPHLATDPEFAARFSREAALLASLDSPHVIAIYDYGRTGDYLYLATQYVGGGDLHAHIRRHGALPPSRALDVFTQIVSALRDAHARGVIHRDVKPSNILLRADRTEPYIYLCDFGIAQSLADDGHTQAGLVAGSLAYMPPERHLGQPATVQSDLYSATCVLWVMLTGSTPYSGTDFQMAIGHASAPVPVLPGAGRTTDELNRTLAWCMAKDPAARPHDAGHLLAHLATVTSVIASETEADDRTVLRTAIRPPVSPLPVPPAAPPPPPPPPPPQPISAQPLSAPASTAPQAEPTRRSRPLAWLAAAVTVVIALATVGYLVWPRPIEHAVPPPRARPSAAPASEPSVLTSPPPTTPTEPVAPSVETSQPPSEEPVSPTTEPVAVEFTCWNGDTVLGLSDCARPRNDSEAFAYLAYVYPAVADLGRECEQRKTPKKYSDVAAYVNCPVSGVSNVRYRYWRNADDANGHYDDDAETFNGGSPYEVYIGDQLVDGWVRDYGLPQDGSLTVTMFLPDQHLSLSIEGKTTKALWAEFDQTRIRPVQEMLGYPSAEGPSVTLLGRA